MANFYTLSFLITFTLLFSGCSVLKINNQTQPMAEKVPLSGLIDAGAIIKNNSESVILILNDKSTYQKSLKISEQIIESKKLENFDYAFFSPPSPYLDLNFETGLKRYVKESLKSYNNIVIVSFGFTGNLVRRELLDNNKFAARVGRLILVDALSGDLDAISAYAKNKNDNENDPEIEYFLSILNIDWKNYLIRRNDTPAPLTDIKTDNITNTKYPGSYIVDENNIFPIIEKNILKKRRIYSVAESILSEIELYEPFNPSEILTLESHIEKLEKESLLFKAVSIITAKLYLELGKDDKTLSSLKNILKSTKSTEQIYPEILSALGDTYRVKKPQQSKSEFIKQLQIAKKYYQKAISISAETTTYFQTIISLVEIMKIDGDENQIIELLQTKITNHINPKDYPFIFAEAIDIIATTATGPGKTEQIERIIQTFDIALNIYKDFPDQYGKIALHKADAYLAAKKPIMAIKTAESAIEKINEKNPFYPMILVSLGKAHLTLQSQTSKLKGIWALKEASTQLEELNHFVKAAKIRLTLGAALYNNTGRRREAEENFKKALKVLTKEKHPLEYGKLHYYLGHLKKTEKFGVENYKTAIIHLQETMELLGEKKSLYYKAAKDLGDIYFKLEWNLKDFSMTIKHYNMALAYFSKEKFPTINKDITSSLGTAYRNSLKGDRNDMMDKAINILKNSPNTPYIQKELGIAYKNKSMGKRAILNKAILHLKESLKNTNKSLYAEVNSRLGLAYAELKDKKSLNLAAKSFAEALKYIDSDKNIYLYHLTNTSLISVYSGLSFEGKENETENFIQQLNQSIQYFSKKDLYYELATARQVLGATFVSLTYNYNENTTNEETALNAFHLASDYFNKKDYPYENAKINLDLGKLHLKMNKDKKNINEAIHYLNLSLVFFEKEGYPEIYAIINNNLGNGYLNRETTNPNLLKAISSYNEALKIWTATKKPYKHATLQNRIGTAYEELTTGSKKNNLKNAIKAFKRALNLLPKEKHPLFFALVNNNLKKSEKELSNIQ